MYARTINLWLQLITSVLNLSQECRLPGSYNTLHEFYGSGIIALAECGVVAQTLKCELLESLLFRACTSGDET